MLCTACGDGENIDDDERKEAIYDKHMGLIDVDNEQEYDEGYCGPCAWRDLICCYGYLPQVKPNQDWANVFPIQFSVVPFASSIRFSIYYGRFSIDPSERVACRVSIQGVREALLWAQFANSLGIHDAHDHIEPVWEYINHQTMAHRYIWTKEPNKLVKSLNTYRHARRSLIDVIKTDRDIIKSECLVLVWLHTTKKCPPDLVKLIMRFAFVGGSSFFSTNHLMRLPTTISQALALQPLLQSRSVLQHALDHKTKEIRAAAHAIDGYFAPVSAPRSESNKQKYSHDPDAPVSSDEPARKKLRASSES
jgi:hypothetical protein